MANDLKISALYIYPIKSLRGISLPRATLTPQGLEHDRRFMLREILPDGTRRNMACYHDPIMVRFMTSFTDAQGRDVVDAGTKGGEKYLKVVFHPTDGSESREDLIPLVPDVTKLKQTEIAMHGSPTMGYIVGEKHNAWFSQCFGKNVELLYVGVNRRKVFGNLSPNAASTTSQRNTDGGGGGGIIQTISSGISNILGSSSNPQSQENENSHEQGLGLADVAAVLVVSDTSLNHVTSLLPPGSRGDITKFRPNIVVSGAREEFEEDFWREITISSSSKDPGAAAGGKEVKVLLTQNCNRCVSLNLDYDTGDFAEGEQGKVLAKLSKTRRVDPGAKYAPVFGRYGFLHREAHGLEVGVGYGVKISGRNEERTSFYWPYKVPS